jgi:hypothetical protein
MFVLGLGVSMYNSMCLKKKDINVYIHPLPRIHNTSLTNANIGVGYSEYVLNIYLFLLSNY